MAKAPVTLTSDPPPVVINAGDPPAAPTVEPAALDPAAPPVEGEDDFSKMFSQFARDEPDPKPVEPPKTPGDAPALAGDLPVPEPVAKVVEPSKPAAEPPKGATEPPAGPDPIERLADLLQQQQRTEQPRDRGAPPPQPRPMFSPEEATAITEFYKEWPEIARAQELAIRAAVQQTTDHVFREMANFLGPRLTLLEQLANNVQADTLERRIPDIDTIADKVAQWVDTQPDYLKAAFTTVMERGTPDQVEDLVGRYRQATGTAAPALIAPAQPAQPQPAAAPPVLSPAARKAVAALAPVSGKRTAPTVGGEPQTFEDAFDVFAKAG